MNRNPISHHMNPARHTRKSIEGNGLLANGPKSGRKGVGKRGKLKGRGKLNSR
jgi:hypothetical protein